MDPDPDRYSVKMVDPDPESMNPDPKRWFPTWLMYSIPSWRIYCTVRFLFKPN